jgi:hypothetical protein
MVNPEYIKRILQAMTDVLKPAGFRKKGKVFVAEREEVVFFVALYNDLGRSLDELLVEIRVGAFSPALADAHVDKAVEKGWHEWSALKGQRPTRVDECHWSRDWPEGDDASISSMEEAERFANEAARYLRECALPELEKLTSASKLHDALYEGRWRGHAIDVFHDEVLFEWATAEGKAAYCGGKPMAREDFGPVKRPAGW